MKLHERWLHALKPMSWPKLLAPMALGQALGFSEAARFAWGPLAVGVAFTMLDAVCIVLLNDWGDRDVDAIKRRRFPKGCSPKTIPEGILPADQVLFGGLFAGVLLLVVAFRGGAAVERPAMGALGAAALAFFAIYTFPPAKLNYRGGGELVEAAGVGVLLPLLNAYLQSGRLASPRALAIAPALFVLALASALASGLSDEESDREGGKRTFTTMLGNTLARGAVLACVMLGAALLAGAGVVSGAPVIPCAGAALVVAAFVPALARRSPAAVTNAFAEQGAFKSTLHKALWGAQLALAVLLIADRLLRR